jgi:hypothetical protein
MVWELRKSVTWDQLVTRHDNLDPPVIIREFTPGTHDREPKKLSSVRRTKSSPNKPAVSTLRVEEYIYRQ